MIPFTRYAIAVEDGQMTFDAASSALLKEAIADGGYIGVDMTANLQVFLDALRKRRANGLPDYCNPDGTEADPE